MVFANRFRYQLAMFDVCTLIGLSRLLYNHIAYEIVNNKNWRRAGICQICCWIHLLVWIYCSCIVFQKALVLDGSLKYVQCVPYAEILQIFYCLAWFDTVEFNRLPCPNDKMYDDVVFANRFRYQLVIFWNWILIELSRFLHAHIACDIDTSKIIAAFCRISCLYDLIRLNAIACRVQATRYTMIWFSQIDSDINWLCLKSVYWEGYLDS